MPRTTYAKPADKRIEGDSFLTSVVYWSGVFEEKFNRAFMAQMDNKKSIVPRWRTLSVLAEINGISISELAEITRIDRSALSHLLTLMEAEELVERRQCGEDKRNVEVHITPRGRRSFEKMLPIRRAIFKNAAKDLSAADIRAMVENLQKLINQLDMIERSHDRAAGNVAGARRSK